MVGLTPQSWRQILSRYSRLYRASARSFRGGMAQSRERRLRGRGLSYRVVDDHGQPRTTLYGAALRALGCRPGERVRVLFDRYSRRLTVEREG